MSRYKKLTEEFENIKYSDLIQVKVIYIIMKNLFIFITLAFISATSVMAQAISISPLVLYEQVNAPLVIDGVSSGYRFGIIGVSGKFYPNNKNNAQIDVGYAYVPSETVNFEGITFKGPVAGLYFSALGKYNLKNFEVSNLYLEQAISHRNLQANNLSGERNGKILLGTSSTIINSYDALIGLDLSNKSRNGFSLATGLSIWSFIAKGTARNQSNTITAQKTIKTNGIDPLLKLSFQKILNNRKLNADLQFKSLYSKLNTGIVSISLKYEYLF